MKIRGNRVEPAEIEAALLEHPHIRQAAVVPLPGEPVRLAATFVPEPDVDEASAAELRAFLADRMPEYLVPAVFAAIDSMPTTPSGKLDVKELTRHALTVAAVAPTPTTAPRTAVETAIAGELAGALGIGALDIDTSVLDLGADSVLLATHSGWLRRRYGVDVPVREIFAGPTVRLSPPGSRRPGPSSARTRIRRHRSPRCLPW